MSLWFLLHWLLTNLLGLHNCIKNIHPCELLKLDSNDLYVGKRNIKKQRVEKLIKDTMNFAKETMQKFVELSTAVNNYTAQSLYEQIGLKSKSNRLLTQN